MASAGGTKCVKFEWHAASGGVRLKAYYLLSFMNCGLLRQLRGSWSWQSWNPCCMIDACAACVVATHTHTVAPSMLPPLVVVVVIADKSRNLTFLQFQRKSSLGEAVREGQGKKHQVRGRWGRSRGDGRKRFRGRGRRRRQL